MTKIHRAGTATFSILIENSRTRVTRWDFAAFGDNTGWHRHAYDYVVAPLFDGVLEIVGSSGERTRSEVWNGAPYFREAGVEHDVLNGNHFPCSFVEIEFLSPTR